MRKISVAISSRVMSLGEAVQRMFEGQPDLETALLPTADSGASDPLYGLAAVPDVLVIVLSSRAEDSARSEETLRALAARPAGLRPALIVIGPSGDAQVMRRAMQASARDFFAAPAPPAELLASVRLIGREKGVAPAAAPGTLTAVINVKGGSGASFLAANLAHAAALQRKAPAALIDLDLQFGAMSPAFELEHRNSLLEALNRAEQLDAVALQGYMAKHVSGVHVLRATPEPLPLPWEIAPGALARVLDLAVSTYASVVVDLPREIDPLTSLVLTQADHIALVTQQSLAHVRNAKYLLRILTEQLTIPRQKIVLVINRYNDKDSVRERDIEQAINPPAVAVVPNDVRVVTESLNTGVPLLDLNRTAPVSKAVQELAVRLCGLGADATEPSRRRSLREALVGTFGGSRG